MTANRATAAAFLILAAILAAVMILARGPTPLPSNALADRFSAARAIVALDTILAENVPHPIGTRQHDVVRDRIVGHLQQLGYETTLQKTFACNAYATCAPVANILARLPGDARADTLLVSAHYDSVAAGPGASDDGIGFAALLEVARAIRNEHFRNTVLFLITDGEEEGLLGAEGFVADPAVTRGVSAAINIDNRGTSGPSYLFETSNHNRWLMPLLARGLPRPIASSFFYSLYELLPNDTDMSVFRRIGMAGINFACIGRVAHYHTPLDDLRHVTPSTVQDHGAHILAMTRVLANADLRQSTDENAVFFDLLTLALVWWPASWSKWMAISSLAILLIGAAIRIRDRQTSSRALTAGVASFLLSVIAAAALGGICGWISALRDRAAIWIAQPGPVITAMWMIGLATTIVCAGLLRKRAGVEGLMIGHALCWTAIAFGLTIVLPGGSYLGIVPAVVLAFGVLLLSVEMAAVVAATFTALIWIPIIATLYELAGHVTLPAIAAGVALMATSFTPIVSLLTPTHRAAVAAMLTTAAACLVMQLLIPAYTAESPRRMNIQYVDDDGTPRWNIGNLPAPPPPRLSLSPPECGASASAGLTTLRCRSTRGANRFTLLFYAPDLIGLRINGVTPPQQPPKFRQRLAPGWHLVSIRGTPEAQIEITLRKSHSLNAQISDRSFTLPPEAAPILRARAAAHGVPSDEGDGIVVRRRLRL